MTCVSTLSTLRNTTAAIDEVVSRVRDGLAGKTADLALAFVTEHHADSLGLLARRLREEKLARHVIGCTAESVAGADQEVEASPGMVAWGIELPGVSVEPRRLTYEGQTFVGWEPLSGVDEAGGERPALIALGDPHSFPVDAFLKTMKEDAPGLRVVGGMASASQVPRGNYLVIDDEVFRDGAVAVGLTGPVRLSAVVSQGCRPVGRPMIVTKADQNLIRELGRRPALEVLREMFEELPEDDQQLIQAGLHIGRVINEYQETFGRGDFLIRNVLGADEAGGIAVTDLIRVGQTVQFHVRDAASAHDDLTRLLDSLRLDNPSSKFLGGLLFTCNGRGSRLFDVPDHDIATVHDRLGPVPVAGFFAMGEIGPIGGQNFVHGFTASLLLFEHVAAS